MSGKESNIIQSNMNIYAHTQTWKFGLIGFAIVIGISSLFVTNILVKELKKEERKKIELWADATKYLINVAGAGDYSLAIKVISENTNIPVILVDACDSILEHRNFDHVTKFDQTMINIGFRSEKNITNSYLRKELDLIREGADEPIEIDIIGDTQWIYYKDSDLLRRLRYYPIYQLIFIGIFMFIAYITFNASRKSEQNQVWAGMAKETAHQIATPLSSLMAWIELLKEKDGVDNMVHEMSKDVKRLETITDRFSKIGSQAELINQDIVALIRKAIDYLDSRIPVNSRLVAEFPNKSIYIPISPTLFQWVVENLVKNAVDAIKGKGEIKVSISEDTTKVIIRVTDNGCGIDRALMKNIFKPGVTSKKRGWGLGLSLSKRIIEDYHKGSIFVMNSEKNVGTTIAVYVPKESNRTIT